MRQTQRTPITDPAESSQAQGRPEARAGLSIVANPHPVQFPQAAQNEHHFDRILTTLPLAARRYVESLSEVLA